MRNTCHLQSLFSFLQNRHEDLGKEVGQRKGRQVVCFTSRPYLSSLQVFPALSHNSNGGKKILEWSKRKNALRIEKPGIIMGFVWHVDEIKTRLDETCLRQWFEKSRTIYCLNLIKFRLFNGLFGDDWVCICAYSYRILWAPHTLPQMLRRNLPTTLHHSVSCVDLQ